MTEFRHIPDALLATGIRPLGILTSPRLPIPTPPWPRWSF
ncbi:MAG: hypothetical protein RL260_3447 [Pseudomonadota bacterium]|jgi:hypothetical protein